MRINLKKKRPNNGVENINFIMYSFTNMKNIIFVLYALAIIGCAQENIKISQDRSLRTKSMILTQVPFKNQDKSIDHDQAIHDIEYLSNLLRLGYGGAKYSPQQNFSEALEELNLLTQSLPQKIQATELCNLAANIIKKIPDRHLNLVLNNQKCGSANPTKGNVGKNFGINNKRAWEFNFLLISRKISIPVFSIHRFPSPEDIEWKGFQELVQVQIKTM